MEQPFQRSSALYPCVSPIFPDSRKAVDRRIFLESCNHFPPPLKSLISEGAFPTSAAKAPARHPQPSFVQKPLLFKLFAFFPPAGLQLCAAGGSCAGALLFSPERPIGRSAFSAALPARGSAGAGFRSGSAFPPPSRFQPPAFFRLCPAEQGIPFHRFGADAGLGDICCGAGTPAD